MKRLMAIWSIGTKVLECIAHLVVGESCTITVKVYGVQYAITIVRVPS